MQNHFQLQRLPFPPTDGRIRYRVMGEMTDDPDVEISVAVESLTDMNKLPACVDCWGDLGWAEVVYGVGARQCMQCGSVYVVEAKP